MRIFSYLVLLIILLIGVTFACLNAAPVTLRYYIGESNFPLSLLLAFTLIVGVILGLVVAGITYIKLKTQNIRLNQRVKFAEQEVANLRSIPLKDDR